jgi:hypothetical protein
MSEVESKDTGNIRIERKGVHRPRGPERNQRRELVIILSGNNLTRFKS